METQVYLYTNGACKGNPSPGDYPAILECNGRAREMTGGAAHTTNSSLELLVVITWLRARKLRCQMMVVTDSPYVATNVNGCTEQS